MLQTMVQRPIQACAMYQAVCCYCLQAAYSAGLNDVHVPEYDAWDGLALTYTLKWPLHILLTPEVNLSCLHAHAYDQAPAVSYHEFAGDPVQFTRL